MWRRHKAERGKWIKKEVDQRYFMADGPDKDEAGNPKWTLGPKQVKGPRRPTVEAGLALAPCWPHRSAAVTC